MTDCTTAANILWKIENFSDVYQEVCPGLIVVGPLRRQLVYSQCSEAGNRKIRLTLVSLIASEKPYEYRVDVDYLYSNGNRKHLINANYSLEIKEWCVWSDSITDFKKNYCGSNFIVFLVQVTPVGDSERLFKDQKSDKALTNDLLCMESLIGGFRKLFNNEEHSDFTLKCGDKSFYVHKIVLSAGSDFFAAMFRSDMKETNEGTGEMKDIEPDILELVLCYLYTEKVPEMSMETLKKVYIAADKFAVQSLRNKCLTLLIDYVIIGSQKVSNKETEKGLEKVNEEAETE